MEKGDEGVKEKGNPTRGWERGSSSPHSITEEMGCADITAGEPIAVRATCYYQRTVAPFANSSNSRPLSTIVSRPPLCSTVSVQYSISTSREPRGEGSVSPN